MIAKIYDQIYFGNVIVCPMYEGFDQQSILDELIVQKFVKEDETLETLGLDRPHVGANTMEYMMSNKQYIILFLFQKDLQAIVHECVHIVNMIFDARRIKIDYKNDEHYAYYVAYWFNQIWDTIDKIEENLNKQKSKSSKKK